MKALDRVLRYMAETYEVQRKDILEQYTKPMDAFRPPWQDYLDVAERQACLTERESFK